MRQPVRVGTRISADSNDWLDNRSLETGFTKSSLMNIAIENYRKECEVVSNLPLLLEELKKQGIDLNSLVK